MTLELALHINGERRPANSGATYESRDPYRDEVWAPAPDGDASDVDDAVAAARAALDGTWGETTGSDRARLLRRLAELIERDADRLADLESRDNGKLLREMDGDQGSVGGADRQHPRPVQAGLTAPKPSRPRPARPSVEVHGAAQFRPLLTLSHLRGHAGFDPRVSILAQHEMHQNRW